MSSDYLIRAVAANRQIRAFAATTRETVEFARQAHGTSPVATAALGRLMTAGAMMGSMMKGENDLLTLRMSGDGPMRGMLVTANVHAKVKGYVYEEIQKKASLFSVKYGTYAPDFWLRRQI